MTVPLRSKRVSHRSNAQRHMQLVSTGLVRPRLLRDVRRTQGQCHGHTPGCELTHGHRVIMACLFCADCSRAMEMMITVPSGDTDQGDQQSWVHPSCQAGIPVSVEMSVTVLAGVLRRG